jgi:hypothetical protein
MSTPRLPWYFLVWQHGVSGSLEQLHNLDDCHRAKVHNSAPVEPRRWKTAADVNIRQARVIRASKRLDSRGWEESTDHPSIKLKLHFFLPSIFFRQSSCPPLGLVQHTDWNHYNCSQSQTPFGVISPSTISLRYLHKSSPTVPFSNVRPFLFTKGCINKWYFWKVLVGKGQICFEKSVREVVPGQVIWHAVSIRGNWLVSRL